MEFVRPFFFLIRGSYNFYFESCGSPLNHWSIQSKKSPTGPTERTPNPEYLIALAINLGVRW